VGYDDNFHNISGQMPFKLVQSMTNKTRYMSFRKAIEKITDDPQQYDDLVSLYGGEAFPPLPKPSSTPPCTSLDILTRISVDMDLQRIFAIIKTNSFSLTEPNQDESKENPTALYLLPSYFNHSCLPNAMRQNIGDIAVIQATKKILKGEEITLSYTDSSAPYDSRSITLTT
jgi:hypothetical protein